MRIQSIRLRNFQIHKDLLIEFSPTITTIEGPTDVGKSAIIRALQWVCLNNFAGDEFVRDGQKQTEVIIQIRHQKQTYEIRRTKTRKGPLNEYSLDSQVFRAFGTSVPNPIQVLLSVADINFQSQHDSPFWFNEIAGEVSRRLNAVIDLSVIDTCLSNIGYEVRRAQERKALCEERVVALKSKVEEAEKQRPRIEEFQTLRKKYEQVSKLQIDTRCMDELLASIDSNAAGRLRNKADEAGVLHGFGRQYFKLARSIAELELILIQIKNHLSHIRPLPDFALVHEAYQDCQELEAKASGLDELIQKTVRLVKASHLARVAADNAHADFHKHTKDEICPLCKKPL